MTNETTKPNSDYFEHLATFSKNLQNLIYGLQMLEGCDDNPIGVKHYSPVEVCIEILVNTSATSLDKEKIIQLFQEHLK